MTRLLTATFDASISPFLRKVNTLGTSVDAFVAQSAVGFDRVDRNAQKASRSINLVNASLGGLAAATVVRGLTAMSDQFIRIENQLQSIGIEGRGARDAVYALAIETRTPIEQTTALLQRMQKALPAQDLDRTMRQVATLNRLLVIGGRSTQERSATVLQFGQALQSGRLQGEELRSLRENAPIEFIRAIAEAAGGTIEELKDLGSEGVLTTEVMIEALNRLEQESIDRFGNFTMTVQEAAEAFQTGFINAIGRFDEGLGATEAISAALQNMGTFLLENGDAMQTMGEAIKVLVQLMAVLIGARGLAGIARAGASAVTALQAVTATAVASTAGLTGLRALLAILGGPLGLAFAASTVAVGLFARAMGETAAEARSLADATALLDSVGNTISEVKQAIEVDNERLIEQQARLAEAIENGGTAAELAAQAEIAAIEDRIGANERLLESERVVQEARAEQAAITLASRQGQLRREVIAEIARVVSDQEGLSGPGLYANFRNFEDYYNENDVSIAALGEILAQQIRESEEPLQEATIEVLERYNEFIREREELDARLAALAEGRELSEDDPIAGPDLEAERAAAEAAEELNERVADSIAEATEAQREYNSLLNVRRELQDRIGAADANEDVRELYLTLNDVERQLEEIASNSVADSLEQVDEILRLIDQHNLAQVDAAFATLEQEAIATRDAILEAQTEVGDLDGASLENITSRVFGLAGAFRSLLASISTSIAALNEQGVPGTEPFDGPSPPSRPTDIDFGNPAPRTGGSGSRGGSGSSGPTDEERFAESLAEQRRQQELDLQLIGLEDDAVAALRLEYRLLEEARRRGVDLDDRAAGSSQTYRQQIEALTLAAAANVRAEEARADALAQVEERTNFVTDAYADFQEGTLDAIFEAENFSDVLGDLATMFARAAAQAALFGTGPFGAGGGFNIFSGIGSLFGFGGGVKTGAFATGGIVRDPTLALIGEGSMDEAVVPLPDGRSIPVTLNMPDINRLQTRAEGSSGATEVLITLSPQLQAAILAEAGQRSVQSTGVMIRQADEAQVDRFPSQVQDYSNRYG